MDAPLLDYEDVSSSQNEDEDEDEEIDVVGLGIPVLAAQEIGPDYLEDLSEELEDAARSSSSSPGLGSSRRRHREDSDAEGVAAKRPRWSDDSDSD